MMRRRFKNDYFYGLFFLTVITLLFFFPVVIGIQSLFEAYPVFYNSKNFIPPQIKTPWVIDGGTYVRTTAPATMLAAEIVKSGRLPLWSPYDGAGENLLLLGTGFYNPLRLLYFSLMGSLRAFDWAIILRFLIAGFGLFLYLKKLGFDKRSALFGGTAFMFSGYFVAFMTYWSLDIEATLPYVLWGIERCLRSPKGRRGLPILLTGIFAGLLVVVGQPQAAILSTLLFGSYYIFRLVSDSSLRGEARLHFINLLLIGLVAILTALPYFADLLTLFSQAITIYDFGPFLAAKHGFAHSPWIYLLHLFVSPSSFLEMAIGGHLFDQFTYIVPYTALTVIFLILASFFIPAKPKFIFFYYFFALLALLKIFGFPLVNWVGALPIMSQIGYHKLYGQLALVSSVIAAFAFSRLSQGDFPWRKFLASLFILPAAFVLAYFFSPQEFLASYVPRFDFLSRRPETIELALGAVNRFPGFVREAALKFLGDGRYFTYFLFGRALLFSGLILLLIFFATKKKKKIALALLFVFLIFESWLYMPKVRDGFRYFNPYEKPPFVEFLESKAKKDYFAVLSTDYTFPVSLGDLFHIRKFQTTSAIFPRRFWHFVPDTLRKNDHDYFKLLPGDFKDTPQQFFDAANIKYLVTEATSSFSSANKNFALVYDEDLRIYENKSVLPRAYLVFSKETVSSPEEGRRRFYESTFPWRESVILEDNNLLVMSNEERVSFEEAKITSYFPDEIAIETNSSRDGVLVFTDAYYSAWKAYVDGRETKIYPANVLFRGVFVPRGRHEIVFTFSSPWLWPSVALSLGVILVPLALFLAHVTIGKRYSKNDEG